MIVPGIGKIVEGINSVNSAIDSNRAEKVIFLESDKTTSHRLDLLIAVSYTHLTLPTIQPV